MVSSHHSLSYRVNQIIIRWVYCSDQVGGALGTWLGKHVRLKSEWKGTFSERDERYFETNKVNPKNLYILFKKYLFETNPTK